MSFFERMLRGRPPATGDEADRITLLQLQGMGADLTKPRELLHFIELPSQAAAERAAEELERAGFETTTSAPGEPDAGWLVRGRAIRVVDSTTVPAFRAWCEALAARHDGEYEGWEVSPRP